ncbi:helix-turn-helix transcriptional regulator [Acidaminococcus fermentans]|uniref:Helix-turn-helix transcriptional regulator n=1 Tax=Acidaminococcus fermentans TaxID=905 RepID=A0A6N7W4H6_ACIFE|nr:helix-turn-helix transcriptional regulator [Acidaminococcus fermentans]MSS83126.1 helix-turn-helix transcriptional regulator [Acidaminococcus fermentans]
MKLNTEKLCVLMAQNKLTLSAMVEKAKISRSTMWQILNRKRKPNLETVGKIAAALDVSPADIIEK